MTQSIAVVGGGIAGLSAAYRLAHPVPGSDVAPARVTLFESADYAGGHANTIEVDEQGTTLGIDTAFVVFNARTYPQLSTFFDDLGVGSQEHHGGFNFFDLDTGLDYGTRELDLDESEVVGRYPESFVSLWREARRFHAEAPRDFLRQRTNVPLGQYLDERGYSDDFKYGYVVLLATAVWSVPAELIWEMPATTVIAFYMSHDQEALGGRTIAWKTVSGGSISYVRAITQALGDGVVLDTPVRRVRDLGDRVEVVTDAGPRDFDQVVVATHADTALELIEDPTARQAEVLSTVRYSATSAILHTDPAVMPRARERWASWNYGRVQRDGTPHAWVAYYMNSLQGFTAQRDYFVTLDCPIEPDPATVIREISYTHPIIDMPVRTMQKGIQGVNAEGRVKLAGSYFHAPRIGLDLIGSHEAGHVSGLLAADAVVRDSERPEGRRSA